MPAHHNGPVSSNVRQRTMTAAPCLNTARPGGLASLRSGTSLGAPAPACSSAHRPLRTMVRALVGKSRDHPSRSFRAPHHRKRYPRVATMALACNTVPSTAQTHCLTTRSTGPATAAVAWPLQAMVVIVLPRPGAVCRSGPVSSNVRPHTNRSFARRDSTPRHHC
jgi:hypothetical protein